jgi:hypothetical protein
MQACERHCTFALQDDMAQYVLHAPVLVFKRHAGVALFELLFECVRKGV